jgi:predicted RNA-binding protein with PUA-like domain
MEDAIIFRGGAASRSGGASNTGASRRRFEMANKWLFKEEPTHYSFSDFSKDGKTVWEGVRNPVAQRNLRQVKKGDSVFYYHTGKEKAVVGVARAASDAYPDPKQKDGKSVVVDLVPVKALPQPVTLASIKALSGFKGFDLVRLPRLSVMPVTEGQWKKIESMAKK